MDIKKFYIVIENALEKLGVDAENCRTDKPGQWDLSFGSITLLIDVFEHNNVGYFQCLAPIMKIPENHKEKFYEELLEYNHSFFSASFSKFKDWIYLKHSRELEDLSVKEAIKIIKRIAVYADNLDNILKDKYLAQNGSNDVFPQNTPTDVLRLFITLVEKNNFEALSKLCDPEQQVYDEILTIICKIQDKEKIKQILSTFEVFSDFDYFSHENIDYAKMSVKISGLKKNLFFVKRKEKWYFYQFTDEKN